MSSVDSQLEADATGTGKRVKSKADRQSQGDCAESLVPYDESDQPMLEEKLRVQNEKVVQPHLSEKYQNEAKAYWDKFYKRNETNFFKDRCV